MACETCQRPTPQRLGDPAFGRCPDCGSTLGRTLDDGTPIGFVPIRFERYTEPASWPAERVLRHPGRRQRAHIAVVRHTSPLFLFTLAMAALVLAVILGLITIL